MAKTRLKEIYLKDIIPALMEKFQYKSVMQVPKVLKISVNKGIGAAVADNADALATVTLQNLR